MGKLPQHQRTNWRKAYMDHPEGCVRRPQNGGERGGQGMGVLLQLRGGKAAVTDQQGSRGGVC